MTPFARWFARESAVILAFVSAFLQMLIAYNVPISDGLAIAINAVVAAAVGVITAVVVRHDGQLPAILGLGQAAFTLLLALGVHLSETQISKTMAIAAIVLGFAIRDRVVAPVTDTGAPVAPPSGRTVEVK